jgi:ATP-dependent Lhr-like helicase
MQELGFHRLVRQWFETAFPGPTQVQLDGWKAISEGRDALIAAPTGSGKTLAAFLWAVNSLFKKAENGALEDRIHVVYISPLKALGNDIEKNLRGPLAEIDELARNAGLDPTEVRVGVRSGDTSGYERQRQIKRPPHILITTPESFYILLTAEKSRAILRRAETIIVDEIHAVADSKRGTHLALSLERFDRLAERPVQRIGLSATQNPLDEVARLLIGARRCLPDGRPQCTIVDSGHRRQIDLSIELIDYELGPIASHELRGSIYDRMAELVREHRSTIVFTNTRRMVERVAHSLTERLGKDKVRAHHGSLSRDTRLGAEQGLKSGDIPVIVATASLELGIDVGHVDLVCHLGAPRSIAQLLQRVGRSGHFLGAIPKGILFPLTRDELVQAAASVRAVESGVLDRLSIPTNALDILAQQIVAQVASEALDVEELWGMVTSSHPYRDLERSAFDDVLEMLSEGVSTRRGRRSAHIHYDRVNNHLRPRRGARLAAITSGGAIPDMADYDVVEDASNAYVGTVNEDFAIESLAGDIFQLGNRSWRVQRIESGRVRVNDAEGLPPTIPFWMGESPGRTRELSDAVACLRTDVAARLSDLKACADWLMAETHVCQSGAEQIIGYVREALAVLGTLPSQNNVVAERFFDEAGGMQLVLHSPFGARVNRALGLALRKSFCVSFDFELQAAATDDGVVLSLGEQHSFPLENIFSMTNSRKIEPDLVQASLQSPMFTNRWRWNATRALAMLRFSGGKRVPIALQRMRAEDLLAAVFPAQLGCQDNRVGKIDPPDHPLVDETIDNCLREAMDTDGAKQLLEDMESGRINTVAVETPSPSPLSHEILNANPYAFLDDAPLEERRARAVTLRRFDPDLASGIGALDEAAIAEVRRQAWPEIRDADELHDALCSLCILPANDPALADGSFRTALDSLRAANRVVLARWHNGGSGGGTDDARPEFTAWVATERAELTRRAIADVKFDPEPVRIERSRPLAAGKDEAAMFATDPDTAIKEILRGWMEALGPTTERALAERLGLADPRVRAALARLELDGIVLQGRFTNTTTSVEWCERGLLARIHRLTIGTLRKEIEPVSSVDFMRFLLRWQHLANGTQLHGKDGLRNIIAQLQGLELPAPAWERDVLPARMAKYDPDMLEQLCLAGEVAWGRLSFANPTTVDEGAARRRRRTITRSIPLAFFLREDSETLLEALPPQRTWLEAISKTARDVYEHLETKGASFLADVARATGTLPTETEEALWELVASGLVTGDGIAGLRTLMLPAAKRAAGQRVRLAPHLRALPGRKPRRMMPTGRWARLRSNDDAETDAGEAVAAFVMQLLNRYGVVFRDLCVRESRRFPWRVTLYELRRMEACGTVRGGRFVDGFVGEQFALPEAVELLRRVRREKAETGPILVSAADPLNLVGIVGPGQRISPLEQKVIAYRGGVAVEIGELGSVRSRLQAELH